MTLPPTIRSTLRSSALVLCLAAPTGAQSKPANGRCAPLTSTVFPADSGRVRASDGALFRSLIDTVTTNLARLEMHVTTLAPGKSPHPPHRHAHEEIMIVRTGTLDVLQNDVTRRAGAGAVIFEASNELHGLRNPGPDSATYVMIRIDPHDLAGADTSRCSRGR
jgi:XRE family transcriptional regulator, regulator of sulfur utilization